MCFWVTGRPELKTSQTPDIAVRLAEHISEMILVNDRVNRSNQTCQNFYTMQTFPTLCISEVMLVNNRLKKSDMPK